MIGQLPIRIDYWRWGFFCLPLWMFVGHVFLQQGDMESRMDLVSGRADFGFDDEGSELLRVQLVRGAVGLDVPAQQPNFLPDFKVRSQYSFLVCPEGLLLLSALY